MHFTHIPHIRFQQIPCAQRLDVHHRQVWLLLWDHSWVYSCLLPLVIAGHHFLWKWCLWRCKVSAQKHSRIRSGISQILVDMIWFSFSEVNLSPIWHLVSTVFFHSIFVCLLIFFPPDRYNLCGTGIWDKGHSCMQDTYPWDGVVMTPLRFGRKIPTSFLACQRWLLWACFCTSAAEKVPREAKVKRKPWRSWCLPSGLLPKLSNAKLQVFLSWNFVGFLRPLVNASFKISNA